MDTEDFAFNDSSNTEIVEDFSAIFPRVGVSILSDCLIIKTVNSCNLSSLVVTSEQGDVSWIFQL